MTVSDVVSVIKIQKKKKKYILNLKLLKLKLTFYYSKISKQHVKQRKEKVILLLLLPWRICTEPQLHLLWFNRLLRNPKIYLLFLTNSCTTTLLLLLRLLLAWPIHQNTCIHSHHMHKHNQCFWKLQDRRIGPSRSAEQLEMETRVSLLNLRTVSFSQILELTWKRVTRTRRRIISVTSVATARYFWNSQFFFFTNFCLVAEKICGERNRDFFFYFFFMGKVVIRFLWLQQEVNISICSFCVLIIN